MSEGLNPDKLVWGSGIARRQPGKAHHSAYITRLRPRSMGCRKDSHLGLREQGGPLGEKRYVAGGDWQTSSKLNTCLSGGRKQAWVKIGRKDMFCRGSGVERC